jgi:hypothetical protein
MTHHATLEHIAAAGLTATSIVGAVGSLAGVLPVIATVIASVAGLAAIVSYVFSTLDSPSFRRLLKSNRPAKPWQGADASDPTDIH